MPAKYRYSDYPVGSYKFSVLIGEKKIGFHKISGLKFSPPGRSVNTSIVSNEKEMRAESNNLYSIEEEAQEESASQSSIQMERAVKVDDKEISEYMYTLVEKSVKIPQIQIILYSSDNTEQFKIYLTDCYVVSFSYSDLNAMNSTYLNQVFSVVYHSMKIVY